MQNIFEDENSDYWNLIKFSEFISELVHEKFIIYPSPQVTSNIF